MKVATSIHDADVKNCNGCQSLRSKVKVIGTLFIKIIIIIIIIIITTTIFMVLSSWHSAIARVHPVHMMNAD